MMIWDFDKRPTRMSERLMYELPFANVLPDEFEYGDNEVRLIYSDLGVSAEMLEKLMKITIRKDGKNHKLARITVDAYASGDFEADPYPDGPEKEIIRKSTIVVFE